MISVAAELQSIRSGVPLHNVEQVLTSYRVFVAGESREPSQSFRPCPQLAHVLLVSPAMGAGQPFAAGASDPGCLTPNKQSVTRGTGEQ